MTQCIRTCPDCARHDHAHCRRCAEMCREGTADCRRAIATLG